MSTVSYFLLGGTFAFASAVQPEPLQTYIISQTLQRGLRSTLPAAVSPLLSDGPIIVLVLFLLKQMPHWLQPFLLIGGGIFLLYLALRAYQTWRHFDFDKSKARQMSSNTMFRAALVNLLNPNPYLGWSLVLGPLLLQGWQETPVNGIALLAGFYLTMIISLAGIIWIFSFARHLGPGVNRTLLAVSALALFGFAMYQLWLGISQI